MATKLNDVFFVQCRLLGHAWDEIPSNISDKGGKKWIPGQRMSFRCVRCGTIRNEVWSKVGELVTRSYDYTEHYTFAKEIGRAHV